MRVVLEWSLVHLWCLKQHAQLKIYAIYCATLNLHMYIVKCPESHVELPRTRSDVSLIPKPTPFILLQFAFYIKHMKAEEREKRERPGNTYHVNDVRCTQGGCRGDHAQLQIRVQ